MSHLKVLSVVCFTLMMQRYLQQNAVSRLKVNEEWKSKVMAIEKEDTKTLNDSCDRWTLGESI